MPECATGRSGWRVAAMFVLMGVLGCAVTRAWAAPATSTTAATTTTPATTPAAPPTTGHPVKLDITAPGVSAARIYTAPDGRELVHIRYHDGTQDTLDGDQLLAMLHQRYTHRSWLQTLLNVSGFTGVLWVVLGFSAQVLFTGRMLVQWLVSERAGRSVVPTAFWWMSLVGGAMLLVYFSWRRDVVGIFGQSTGILIYSRNLVLLYFPKVGKDHGLEMEIEAAEEAG